MVGLADCNNFFVSCERVFNPSLEGKPVIVLSNNDGCAIARSNEAKAIGIRMGDPLFKIRDLIRRYDVKVYSGNMPLYADMSRRVQEILRELSPAVEPYSIDEAFLDLSGIPFEELSPLGRHIARTVKRSTGIPISVGISPTKTLAKIASHLCKHYPRLEGVCVMARPEDVAKVLRRTPIEEVWGIGRRLSKRLIEGRVLTAADFLNLDEAWVLKAMGINGVRTQRELRLIPSIGFEEHPEEHQSLTTSRSFSEEISDKQKLSEQLVQFAMMTAERLRRQRSLCGALSLFVQTNRFRDGGMAGSASALHLFATPTDSSLLISRVVREELDRLFLQGVAYKRAGVTALRVIPRDHHHATLFENPASSSHPALMQTLDSLNQRLGQGSLRLASEGLSPIANAHNFTSGHYTTNWNDLLKVKNL